MRIGLMSTPLAAPDFNVKGAEYLFQESGGNTGNFAFVYALHQQLGPNATTIPWWYTGDRLKDNCDLIVIACANQLGKHTDLGIVANNLQEAGLPIVAVGLGAQSSPRMTDIELTDGTRRWLDVISNHSPSTQPNIGVRGSFTADQICKLGYEDRVEIIGCPSNFINLNPLLGKEIENRDISALSRVAVPAGHHLWSQLAEIEQTLADVVDRTQGIYVGQSEIDMLRLSAHEFDQISPKTLEDIRNYIQPNKNLKEFKDWIARHMVAYSNAASWISNMKDFQFVVGARFHGVMLAIQGGVAGGVIAHDSRTVELCETTCIPFKTVDKVNVESLRDSPIDELPFDGTKYDSQRGCLARRYSSLLSGADIDASFLEKLLPS